jgi:uncharacterized membrane protein (DUF373 family)
VKRFTDRVVQSLHWATIVIEVLVAVALIVLAAMTLLALFYELLHLSTNGVVLVTTEFNRIISTILEIFIVVELFRIAVAYMRHEHVIPTVLEAALVAVARKFVVLEPAKDFLQLALGLSALLLAVAVSWWLIAHSGRLETEDDETVSI